jgi:hypothetical protein
MKHLSWLLLLVLACSTPQDPEPPRYRLVVVSGDGQEAEVTETLDAPLVFRLRDQYGEAKTGVRVVFELSEGAGSFLPAEANTNSAGEVITQLTLGTLAGTLTVTPDLPDLSDLESVASMTALAHPGEATSLAWAQGDGQKDAPGSTLLVPLGLEAQDIHGNAVGEWVAELSATDGSSVNPTTLTTSESQAAECQWTLGGELGSFSLIASAEGLLSATATAQADLAPSLTGIQYEQPADEGDEIHLDGENFCAVPEFNTVTLGGLPMVVIESSETDLTALVPVGLGLGQHEISLSVGSQPASEHFTVEVSLALGRVLDYPMVDNEVVIPISAFSDNTSYIAIAYNLRDEAPYEQDWVSLEAAGAPAPLDAPRDFAYAFHTRMLSVRGQGKAGPIADREDSRDRQDFYVFSDYFGSTGDPASYEVVAATLRYEGEHVGLFVDSRDVNRLPQDECNEIGQAFETQIYDRVRQNFGAESDYDGNGRVYILLTRQVNLLTGQIDDNPQWGGEYIGGFFNPVDLPIFSWPAGTSNEREIFYGIVPDPEEEFSKVAHTLASTVAAVKPIVAHEFQHMINFYQRHGVLGADSFHQEELWINEGLSHLAEDICDFDDQNRGRVGIYLHSRQHRYFALASLSGLAQGQAVGNSLGERGASYLFMRYLADRWPGSPEDLVKSIVSGRDNVVQVTGETYAQVFKDWLATLVLDDTELSDDPRYQYTSLNIRQDFPYEGGVLEPLSYFSLELSDPIWNSFMTPGSFDLLELRGPAPGGLTDLRFMGENRGDMGILLIRTGL